MVKKTTRKLSEYNLFIQKECAKLKENGIRISGRGNILLYISKLWQKKKIIETVKKSIIINDNNDNDIDDLSLMISNVSINTDIDDLSSMISNIKINIIN